MSQLRDALLAQLSRFDDEAYVALANRGLLRRAQKDLEKQSVTVLEESAENLVAGLGDHRIVFDARGPAHARCSCPAGGICQHILAAAIGLQRLDMQAAGGEEGTAGDCDSVEGAGGDAAQPGDALPSPGASAAALGRLHDELLALSAKALAKYAGKAGYRWAWQLVHDLDAEQGLSIAGERYLVISFSHPRISFRYLGGSLDNLIADAAVSPIEKYRVAAVLAYQRANGRAIEPPESASGIRTRSLDLGKDHVGVENGSAALADSRERLRARVRLLIIESIELGLSHLSRGIHERYATLAVWAQGAEYYRLALLLRRIADHIDLLLQRAGGADEHRLLDELAIAFGLVAALESAARRDLAPNHLVGQARSRYEQVGALELLGLGANPWRSASGYVGLTMLFWSPALESFLSCTDARPEMQRGFNPMTRYRAPGPWAGLGAPMEATGHRLLLTGAQVNEMGRLSAADSMSATVKAFVPAEELIRHLRPHVRWPELAQERTLRRSSLLATPQPMKDWVALRPERFGRATFDGARQTLAWPLYDENDLRLDAEIPYSENNVHAMTRIERIVPGQLPSGTVIIAKLRHGAAGMIAEPLSLIRPDTPHAQNPVDALYFDEAPEPGGVAAWLSKLRHPAAGSAQESQGVSSSAILPVELRDLKRCLQRQSERGITEESRGRALSEIGTARERACGAGFTALSPATLSDDTPMVQLLQVHYVVLQYERLMDGAQDLIA